MSSKNANFKTWTPTKGHSCPSGSRLFYLLLIALGVFTIFYQQLTIVRHQIHLSYAQEQIDIFHQMVRQSRKGTKFGRVPTLDYVKSYYPSGTKQVKGSEMDDLVEACRHFAIESIEWDKSKDKQNE